MNEGLMPMMVPVHQSFDETKIEDIEGVIAEQFARPEVKSLFKPGAKVAVGVGSRGLDQLVRVVRAVISELKILGTEPFVIPAMGSHGGATAEGQIEILAGYGITEAAVDAPVRATMEVVTLGMMDGEVPVYFDRMAYEADAVVVVNRIKSHTSLQTATQSGVMKMLAIGLGKHKGASALHSHGVKNIQRYIPEAARVIMDKSPFVCGVAMVENAFAKTCALEVLTKPTVEEAEERLLNYAKSLSPALPVDQIDILIVEQIGKNFSGLGMDPYVIGRWKIWGEPEPEKPNITTLIALDLSDPSHGNAGGVGLADLIPRRLLEKIDYHATYTNAITATYLARVQIPVTVETDREAMEVALKVCGEPDLDRVRVVRIKNTLELSALYVSQNIWEEIKSKEGVTKTGAAKALSFDALGNLV